MTRTLKIAAGLALPAELVTQSIAILAKRRAGKSYTARRIVEQLHHAGQQLVIVDPKGDWWGVRSAADGKAPGMPIVILGGERGDVPLEVGAGEVVAKLVVEERPSVLLDLSLFRKHEIATFMAAFLETLYRLKAHEKYRTPMMLVLDEADAIAPQKPQHGEERMLGAAEDIVRRGGQRGLGCMVITQRSAVLNKNVLTQSEVLVALRTIAPQDLDAMNAWIDVHGTVEQRRTLMASLPALPIGDAWFWSPGWPTADGIFRRVHVLPIETFDSGATPKPGEVRREPKRVADVDLDALRRQMASTIEKAKADDPRELRREMATLKRDLAAAQKTAPVTPAERVEVPVLTDGDRLALATVSEKLDRVARGVDIWTAEVATLGTNTVTRHREVSDILGGLRAVLSSVGAKAAAVTRPSAPVPTSRPAVRANRPQPNGHDPASPLGKAERATLAVLATYGPCHAARLALLAGYTWSGGFRNTLSTLRTNGLIVGSNSEAMEITDAGRMAVGDAEPLPTGAALVDHWLGHSAFGKCERAIIATLRDASGMDGPTLATATGYDWSGGFRNSLSTLRTAGVLVGRNSEPMALAEDLRT